MSFGFAKERKKIFDEQKDLGNAFDQRERERGMFSVVTEFVERQTSSEVSIYFWGVSPDHQREFGIGRPKIRA